MRVFLLQWYPSRRWICASPEYYAMTQSQHTGYVLIVDNDVMIRMLAAESLRGVGFEVAEAADGWSGLDHIASRRPDLLLLDVMMPGITGYDVCRALRQQSEGAGIPVIMLTGLDDTASIESAYDSGATDFITKPINSALLTYRVRYALRASRMGEEVERHRRSLANAQRIARMGSWTWQPASALFESSTEYRRVTGEHPMGPDYQWRDILMHVHPDDAKHVAHVINAAVESGNAQPVAYRILCRDGSQRTVYERMEVFRDGSGAISRIEGTTQDITERVAAEERIRQLADYDELTALANRRLFSEVMLHGLNQCARKRVSAAVLDINIDRFKRINETLGHGVGDQALKEVARRITECVRAGDVAGRNEVAPRQSSPARMGSDNFAMFLTELKRAEDAAVVSRRLIEAIALPMLCGGHELTLTARIGIAVYPDNGDTVDALLGNAESAMRGAKELGVGAYSYFTSAMNAESLAKLEIENELRGAIERDELTLFYQARVDAMTGRLIGAEALVRWQHPTRGLVPPNAFIPVAEESGLIAPLTAWVVREACRQLQQWQRAELAVVPLSINLSAHSFREDGLSDFIAASLREFDVAPSLLEAEITESMLMQDVDRAVTRLHQLRSIGIELAMDDFGTGYSSLAYLKRFPLNVLKIDRAFVKDVLTDTSDAAIASAIITLGRTMKLAVVAEGMERVEQANYLLSLGCRYMQGFLFAKPVPANVFVEFLRDGLAMPRGLHVRAVDTETAIRSSEDAPMVSVFNLAQSAPSRQLPVHMPADATISQSTPACASP